MDKKAAKKISSLLEKNYPNATTALRHAGAWQLLVATILSAQCTDARVNKVTPELFIKYRTVKDIASARQPDIEKVIRSTGFYRNKAKNIIGAARMLVDVFGGKVPSTMEDLMRLPGVARKTSNIVLFHSFGKNEGIAVDTHVKRVSFRLGLTRETDPVKIERDLMDVFDRKKWGDLTNLMIAHGRGVCNARKPLCCDCPLAVLCPYAQEISPELYEN